MAILTPAGLARAEEKEPAATGWDFSWMETLKGKHKQVFDFGSMELSDRDIVAGESPLRVPRNWLNAHKEVYGLVPPAVNTVIGITRTAFPMNASDAIWAKYSLGERWKIRDSSTGTWAVRNLFSNPSNANVDQDYSIEALLSRGTIFWQCNNALGGVAASLAAAMKMKPADVREDLVSGFMPGVRLVPAHTMALGLVQERGCTYEKV